MSSSRQLVEAYIRVTEQIKEQRKVMAELKDVEKQIVLGIQEYLNQTDEIGLRIDDNTVITLRHSDKKINRNSKAYKSYLTDLCIEHGLADDRFVAAILNGKVETTVQQQRLKVVKIR
jgi:hypothetical protein